MPCVMHPNSCKSLYASSLLNIYDTYSLSCAWEMPWFLREVTEDHIDILMPRSQMNCHAAAG